MHAEVTDNQSDRKPLVYDIVWGLRYGCQLAAFFIAIATVIRAFAGADAFSSWQSSYIEDVITDLIGGIGGGLILGFLRPTLTSAKAAAMAGFLVLLPVAVAANLEFAGFHWRDFEIAPALIYALAVGPAVGALVFFRLHDQEGRRR